MQDNVADGLAAVASHPVTVQVINEGPGIWGNVATGLITAGAAILAVMLTHRFTFRREKQVSEENLKREQHFIATELLLKLDQFAEGCTQVAMDKGEPDLQGEYSISVKVPVLKLDDVTGDWRSLPSRIMYRIHELPIQKNEADRHIDGVAEYDWPPYYQDSFYERQYQYARLGLKALILSRRLRNLSGLPGARHDVEKWSVRSILWQVWRDERHRRADKARLSAQEYSGRLESLVKREPAGEQT